METACGASAPPSIDCGGVLPPDTSRKLAIVSGTKTVLLLIFVSALAVLVSTRSLMLLKGTDFPHFYCAGRMLADGHGRQLYDADLQRHYQALYARRVGTLYTHPPFEAVLYLAVAWLPLRYAYLLWSFLTMGLLAVSALRLAKEALWPWDWRALIVASLTFIPSLVCVLQGQDSLLLLLLVVLAFTSLRRGRSSAAGCWLALGLFKFQLVLPLVLALLLTQNRRSRGGLAKGFSLAALALAGVSVAISGLSVITLYPKFLLHFHEQPFAGIVPQAMANFRGLSYLLFHRDRSAAAAIASSMLSAAALIMTLKAWKHARLTSQTNAVAENRDEFDLAFANTVLFALLASYHLNPHDLSLLLLPISLLLHRILKRTPRLPRPLHLMTASLLVILFLPPLHLWALRAGVYALVSIPLLALFLTSAAITRLSKATQSG
jgi:hypothetical protein